MGWGEFARSRRRLSSDGRPGDIARRRAAAAGCRRTPPRILPHLPSPRNHRCLPLSAHVTPPPPLSFPLQESVVPVHVPPTTLHQRAALATIRAIRTTFDLATGYAAHAPNSDRVWLNRMLFLETVAGIPGMVAASLRHLKSLRLARYDLGWINTLFEEAENERMHLLTFQELKRPGSFMKAAILGAQLVMWNAFFTA